AVPERVTGLSCWHVSRLQGSRSDLCDAACRATRGRWDPERHSQRHAPRGSGGASGDAPAGSLRVASGGHLSGPASDRGVGARPADATWGRYPLRALRRVESGELRDLLELRRRALGDTTGLMTIRERFGRALL